LSSANLINSTKLISQEIHCHHTLVHNVNMNIKTERGLWKVVRLLATAQQKKKGFELQTDKQDT